MYHSTVVQYLEDLWATSWEKLFVPYANNKDVDQTAHPRSLISVFVIRCLDSIVALFLYIIRNFKPLASFFGWAGQFVSFVDTNPKDRFFHDVTPIIIFLLFVFTARQDYFTRFEPSQSKCREKMGDPDKNQLTTRRTWLEPTVVKWRALKISFLNHSVTGAASFYYVTVTVSYKQKFSRVCCIKWILYCSYFINADENFLAFFTHRPLWLFNAEVTKSCWGRTYDIWCLRSALTRYHKLHFFRTRL